jgi:hypothetical protein
MAQPGRFGRNGREPTMTEAVEDVLDAASRLTAYACWTGRAALRGQSWFSKLPVMSPRSLEPGL